MSQSCTCAIGGRTNDLDLDHALKFIVVYEHRIYSRRRISLSRTPPRAQRRAHPTALRTYGSATTTARPIVSHVWAV